MLRNRLLVAILLIPIGVSFVALGGEAYATFITFFLGIAAWEYWRLFSKSGGYSPSVLILVGGVILLALSRFWFGFEHSHLLLSLLILGSMAAHILNCKRECPTAALDFTISLAGVLYIGWMGAYLISLRALPDGLWWTMLALPTVSVGDAGAFFIGRSFGKHKLAPNISPNKTIEGYLGGVFFAVLGGLLFSYLWGLRTSLITPLHGLILGAVLGVLTPLGDLGESMLKRQFNIKDTGRLLPGHGGVLDRMDSWLWGAAISYYLILWLG
ncbi:MAG: phosphatidate cytidylyltransferase [Bellilinea sp.]|jgi:phosphatidate cytidylyltransferase